MTLNIKYITTKERKHLIWTVDEDLKCNISKITVCDCFLEWGIAFLKKYTYADVPQHHLMKVFIETIPTELTDGNVYSIFGKICIICCRDALIDQNEYVS